MIIVSQDKTDIINFDNIGWLYIEPNDSTIDVIVEEENILIAKYKTLERAKEVLQEIIQAKSDFEFYKHADESERNEVDPFMKTKYNFFDTYEMPGE